MESMIYVLTRNVHSWTRWLVLILALVVIFRAVSGWLGKKPFEKQDNILGASFVGSMHLQLLLGLLLYFFFSPMGLNAISTMGMGAVMKNAEMRYWAVEHISVMILAVILAQVGRSLSKKASTNLGKHKKSAIFYGLALVLVLSRIPWDSLRLFRGL
ncbi:MAG: cytochrome B [Raineya sp.]